MTEIKNNPIAQSYYELWDKDYNSNISEPGYVSDYMWETEHFIQSMIQADEIETGFF